MNRGGDGNRGGGRLEYNDGVFVEQIPGFSWSSSTALFSLWLCNVTVRNCAEVIAGETSASFPVTFWNQFLVSWLGG